MSSPLRTRWWRKARDTRRQTGQPQAGSSGRSSRRKPAFLMRSSPARVKSTPWRALRAGYWWVLRGQLADKQEQIVVAQKEVDELKPILKEVEEYKGKKARLEHKINVINDLKANQRGPVQIMDQVSRALPELLWLDRLDMRAGTITIKGQAFNTNAVAAFLENLGRVPEFQEPVLKDTSKRDEVYNFELNFKFSFAKPPATDGASPGGAEGGAAAN